MAIVNLTVKSKKKEAVQWTGDNPGEILDFVMPCHQFSFFSAPPRIEIVQSANPLYLKHSDWLIKDEAGILSVVSAEKLTDGYVVDI